MGTAFRISTDGQLTVIHSFSPSENVTSIRGPFVQGTDGNLYETDGQSLIFTLTPRGDFAPFAQVCCSLNLIQGRYGRIYGARDNGPSSTTFSFSRAGDFTFGPDTAPSGLRLTFRLPTGP